MNNKIDKKEFLNINCKGFGIIPKLITQDRRLSITSKAIYAYLCSYAGDNDFCYPRKEKICYDLCLSKDTLNKYLKELESIGYICIEHRKNKGKFSNNIYRISKEIYIETLGTENLGYEHSIYDEVATNNNNININNNNINILSINHSDEKDKMENYNFYMDIVKKNISYSDLIITNENSKEKIDEILEIIVETITFNTKPIFINKTSYPAEMVKQRFLKLDYNDIEYILFSLSNNTTKIKNIRNYLIATLYNAKLTKDNYFSALVNHDMYGG